MIIKVIKKKKQNEEAEEDLIRKSTCALNLCMVSLHILEFIPAGTLSIHIMLILCIFFVVKIIPPRCRESEKESGVLLII